MDFDQLAALEKLRSMNSQKKLMVLQAKESQLRHQLKAIQAYRKDLHGTDPGLSPMRSIGADVLWHKWLDQTQNTLNMSLARLLAEKEMVLRHARRDIGRAETVASMRDMAKTDTRKMSQKQQLEKVLALSIVQNMHR